MSKIVAIVVFYVCPMLYGERERESAATYKKCSKSTKCKNNLLIYFICYSYFTHTFYMFLPASTTYVRIMITSLATTSLTKATNWLPLCASNKN